MSEPLLKFGRVREMVFTSAVARCTIMRAGGPFFSDALVLAPPAVLYQYQHGS